MTDIVERLRAMHPTNALGERSMAAQAADEIERLRADYERLGHSVVAWIDCFGALKEDYTELRAALAHYACLADCNECNGNHTPMWCGAHARAALNRGDDV